MGSSVSRADSVVLLVEDDPGLAVLERQVLEMAGFRVEEARRGAEALERVAAGGIAAMVLDYKLPDMRGNHVVAQLGDRLLSMPVIVLTGMEDPAVAEEMLASGITDFLIKDMDLVFLDALPKKIGDALDRLEG